MKNYTPKLKEQFGSDIMPAMMKRFGYKNTMQIPRLQKICVNMGVGDAIADPKLLERAAEELAMITGQKAEITAAKKSISNFKLREGMKIGCRVTLRGDLMYEFLERFINLAVPRIRDFRGLPDKSFDGRGNYSIGAREQIIFPEINVDRVDHIRGLNITFVTSAKSDEEAFELLKNFGMPFKKKD